MPLDREQYYLTKVAEEASEIAQAVLTEGISRDFRLSDAHFTHFKKELNDFLAMIDVLNEDFGFEYQYDHYFSDRPTSPRTFTAQNTVQEHIAFICSGIVQITLKTQQYGFNEKHPSLSLTNKERMHQELNALMEEIVQLNEYQGLNYKPDSSEKTLKRTRVEQSALYSEDLGKLDMTSYRDSQIATCIGCGCDDFHACEDMIHGPCYWFAVDYKKGIGVCSSCLDRMYSWDEVCLKTKDIK